MSFTPIRTTFLVKLAALAALVLLADTLFYGHDVGSTLGLFALCWAVLVAVCRPAARRGAAGVALTAACFFALTLGDAPGLLRWTLFGTALAFATLLPRRRFGNALQWAWRLPLHGVASLVAPLIDTVRLGRLLGGRGGATFRAMVTLLALPLLGSALFLMLFAGANPLIGNAMARIRIPSLDHVVGHVVFAGVVTVLVWSSFRPIAFVTRFGSGAAWPDAPRLPQPSLASVLLSLALFNLLFAVQNGMDIAFLWSGAPLPGSVTMADYAHRGAYALIATALLAGAFVLVLLAPGSRAAASPAARALVVLWVVQNLMLVASSALRTIDYVAAYSLTELRIAALAWMALVAVGLVLICWRMLFGLPARWLVNANALAAACTLAAFTVVDPGAVAARWNVDHARELGKDGPAIDLCYLSQLGSAALVPLVDLERRATDSEFHDRVAWVLANTLGSTRARQADWHHWTWSDARRLAEAERRLGSRTLLPGPPRQCDGSHYPPVPAPPTPLPAPTPLTPEPVR